MLRNHTKFARCYGDLTLWNVPQNAWKWQKSALYLKPLFSRYSAQNGVFWPKIVLVELSSHCRLQKTANPYLYSFSRYLRLNQGVIYTWASQRSLYYISNHLSFFRRKLAMIQRLIIHQVFVKCPQKYTFSEILGYWKSNRLSLETKFYNPSRDGPKTEGMWKKFKRIGKNGQVWDKIYQKRRNCWESDSIFKNFNLSSTSNTREYFWHKRCLHGQKRGQLFFHVFRHF